MQSDPLTSSLSLRTRDLVRLTGRSRLEDVLNVFSPNDAIRQAARFAGRRQALEQMVFALLSSGADIVVFGERGAGKSSLAHMLSQIASGEYRILDYYGDLRANLEKKLLFVRWGQKKFNVISINGFGRTLDDVMHAVLTSDALMQYLPPEPVRSEDTLTGGLSQPVKVEGGTKVTYEPEKPISVKEWFERQMERYAALYGDELLIIIDEFETVKDRTEMAQYLKSAKHARFALIGIANTVVALLGEHASAARDIHAVEVRPMTTGELSEIMEIGSYVLERLCQFTVPAKQEIVHNSHGSPYWCHFLARELVTDKIGAVGWQEFARGSATINDAEVKALLASLPERPTTASFEQALTQTTLGDPITAEILLTIARQPTSMISSVDLQQEFDGNPKITHDVLSQTIEGILGLENSPLEERGRIRDVVSLSFKDPVFRRYILLRNAGL